MATYIIKRHGSNAANQPMTPVAVLGTVEAKNQSEAKSLAADEWGCYVNQHFEAIPLNRSSATDREEAQLAAEAAALDALYWTD